MMESSKKSLAQVITSQNQQQSKGQPESQTQTQSFSTFLTVYSLNLAHRFLDVNDLNTIDYDTVKNVARFCAACSKIALETWDDLDFSQQRIRSV